MAKSDTSQEKKALSDIAASDIVETVPSALIILDRNLNITSANRAFYQIFRTSADKTEGCHIYNLGNRQWDIPALRSLLESVIPHRASVEGLAAYASVLDIPGDVEMAVITVPAAAVLEAA